MNILIYGAGAVGAYFGGRLAERGANVTLLARGAQLAALREAGLRIASVKGDLALRLPVTGRLSEAAPPDLVLLCVKAHDTLHAATELARHLPAEARVVSLQNGLENVEILATHLGAARVIAGTVFIGAQVTAPGVIRHSAAGFVRLGHYPEGSSAPVREVVEFLAAHGVEVKESTTILCDMWKKFLWNVGFNGPSALTRATVGQMEGAPGVHWLIGGLIGEAAAVAQARGVNLGEGIAQKTVAQTQNLAPFKTSMLQDVEAGRPIENDAFYGCLMRYGAAVGVATPLTRMVHDALGLLYPAPEAR